jgi:hypothetical protein
MLFQVKRLVYLNVIWVEVWKEAVMTHFKVDGLDLLLPKFVNDTVQSVALRGIASS